MGSTAADVLIETLQEWGIEATMANGLPYTIAAQVAYPDRQCVAFVGDGGFTMLRVSLRLPLSINCQSRSS